MVRLVAFLVLVGMIIKGIIFVGLFALIVKGIKTISGGTPDAD